VIRMYTNASNSEKTVYVSKHASGRIYKCMNCAEVIENPEGNMYTRRFCSERCKDNYLADSRGETKFKY